MDWSSGYMHEIDYTFGYYGELAPGKINLAMLLAGLEPPTTARGRYLELGFGQGMSINMHAAATDAEFWGVDFNPRHAAHAQALAQASGANAHLSDASFQDLAADPDLPPFDYIVLHGIWSWVADDVRRDICNILRSRLKIGGVVYISYNALPGWASVLPLRHILSMHASVQGSSGAGVLARMEGALNFTKRLAETQARYFTANPAISGRIAAFSAQNPNYLAHEYLNQHWVPMHFAEINEHLSGAKLEYASSASPLDHVRALHFTPEQDAVMQEIQHTPLRETVRDYYLNQQFRRDLFVRGARRLQPADRTERLMNMRWSLLIPPANRSKVINTVLGELKLNDDIYAPVVEALADARYEPKRLRDLLERPELKALGFRAVLEALVVLTGIGHVHPAQSPDEIKKAAGRSHALSAYLLDRAVQSPEASTLPSPVIGAGVSLSRVDQMLLRHRRAGLKTPAEWARGAWSDLVSVGQRMLKDGKPVETEDENVAQITTLAEGLAERLPILQALDVAGDKGSDRKKAAAAGTEGR